MKKLKVYRLSFILLACIVLGGTSQYIYALKFPLYIISLVMIGTTLSSNHKYKINKIINIPSALLLSFIFLFAFYIIPFPPEIWGDFKGRQFITHDLLLISNQLPWLPISLHPEKTFLSLFDLLPIIAIAIIAALTGEAEELRAGKNTLLIAAITSGLLGIMQQAQGGGAFSLYEIYNPNRPLGFFSNTNHFACLMVMIIPLALWTYFHTFNTEVSHRKKTTDRFLGGSAFLVGFFGVILSGSTAGYIMLILCVTFCFLILNKNSLQTKASLICSFIFIVLGLIDVLILNGKFWGMLSKYLNIESVSRIDIFKQSLEFRSDFGYLGIGPGAFQDIYAMYENSNSISYIYVNNAHNDYIQLWIEFGVFGASLIMFFLFWYGSKVYSLLKRKAMKSKLTLIYFLAIGMPLIHSLVDYPLRTISISAVFTFLICLTLRESRLGN